ncbi:hypothetical protein PC114_g10385 [Phytophthora cactorum]|nr:hypothetical protein PC114_g10385 [Phytophthora cactorum]KAG3166426.1 hypothetical protein C6341_g12069 [Phytophthora cactorum]
MDGDQGACVVLQVSTARHDLEVIREANVARSITTNELAAENVKNVTSQESVAPWQSPVINKEAIVSQQAVTNQETIAWQGPVAGCERVSSHEIVASHKRIANQESATSQVTIANENTPRARRPPPTGRVRRLRTRGSVEGRKASRTRENRAKRRSTSRHQSEFKNQETAANIGVYYDSPNDTTSSIRLYLSYYGSYALSRHPLKPPNS